MRVRQDCQSHETLAVESLINRIDNLETPIHQRVLQPDYTPSDLRQLGLLPPVSSLAFDLQDNGSFA